MKKLIRISLLLCLIFLMTSCFKTNHDALNMRQEPLPEITSTLVVPFRDMAKIYGKESTVRSPLGGSYFTTGKIEPDSCDFMTENLLKLANEKKELGLIKSGRNYYSDSDYAEIDSLIKQGKSAGADIVLAGYIYKFEDRIGTDYSADSPASVSFNICFIDIANGKILKNINFNETQQPLSDNLLSINKFLKRGGKWITAKEMAYDGLYKIIEDFK